MSNINSSIHWIVPTLAGTFLATSLLVIYVAYMNYLVEAYPDYAASLIAVNTFARSAGTAASPLFTTFMFNALGVNGGGSLVAGVATLFAATPFVFYKYGKKIRAKSKYSTAVSDNDTRSDEEKA